MIAVRALRSWLGTLTDDAFVGVDDGGLTLTTPGGEAYLEVGGIPFDVGGDEERRQPGDDDGVEYADPRDELAERRSR